MATAWFELKKDSVTPAYAEDVWRSLRLHVFPELKTTPLSKITAPIVIELLRPIEAKGSLETLKRLSQRLNEIMTYGVSSGLIFANPLSGIRAVFKKPKKQNMAALRRDELSELMIEIANASIKRITRCLIEWQLHHDPSCRSGYHSMGRHRLRQTHLDHPAGAYEKTSSAHHPADRTGTCVTGGAQAPSAATGNTCSRQIEIRAPTPTAKPPTWR